jgi:hypothetical protein
MKTICVFCGSADSVNADYKKAAYESGRAIAQGGFSLVYGGGKIGLMGSVADGAISAGGEVIGVIITAMNTAALAHIGIARMEVTATMHERKARMHELADAFIALPGGFGTFDELFETVTWAQIGAHQKPIGLLNTRSYFDPLIAMVDHAEREGFIFKEHRHIMVYDPSPDALLEKMKNQRHPADAVRRWMRQE